jgi:dihydroorotase
MTELPTGSGALPVTVIDPVGAGPWPGNLRIGADGTATLVPNPAGGQGQEPGADGLYLSPGWIDLHTHVFDGFTQLGVRPDRAGLDSGVHLVADAGSAGQMTVRGMIDYLIPTARTKVRIWLNIGSHGLVHLRETAHPSFIDTDATIAAVRDAGDVVCGIKVRSSGLIVGDMGLRPLQAGKLVAREVGLPLMVHIGEAPPPIDEVLDLLDPGDVVTHCFHGKPGGPWLPDGTPTPALRGALDRGVLLDVGHGAASFDIDVARAAVAAGYPPHTISTDLHIRNINGPVFDLATVMTKLLYCGMSLPDVVAAVTTNARRVLREPASARLDSGHALTATVFRVSDEPPVARRYVDAGGKPVPVTRHLVPLGVVAAGAYQPLG